MNGVKTSRWVWTAFMAKRLSASSQPAGLKNMRSEDAGDVLDSGGYGLAVFRVAGALAPSSRFQQRDEGVPLLSRGTAPPGP